MKGKRERVTAEKREGWGRGSQGGGMDGSGQLGMEIGRDLEIFRKKEKQERGRMGGKGKIERERGIQEREGKQMGKVRGRWGNRERERREGVGNRWKVGK